MARIDTEHTVFLGHQDTDDDIVIAPLAKAKPKAASRYQQLDERMIYAARLRQEKILNLGANPLLTAASGVFQAMISIASEGYAAPSALKDDLVQRIKDFEFMAMSMGCEQTEVIASRYVLCTALDEAVTTKPWSHQLDWARNSLLIIFHNEASGGEKLFQLLDKLSRNPTRHLNILELIYLCLSLGYEGKYRVLQRGLTELEAIRGSLFRQIRTLRGAENPDLAINWQPAAPKKQKLPIYLPLWLIGALTLGALGIVYSGFHYVLEQQTTSITSLYQQLGKETEATLK